MTDATPSDSDESIDDLRAENERLQSELDTASKRSWRMYAATVLVVLFALTLGATNHVVWAATTLLNTEIFVDTLAPLPEDPDVAAALGQRFSERLLEENDVRERIAEALPEGIAFIAVPLAEAVGGVIADIAARLINSDAFTAIWETALRVTHSAAIALVEGGPGDRLVTDEGNIGIDLTALVTQVDEALNELGIDILEADEEVVIVIYEAESLGVVQTIAQAIYAIRWATPILTLVLLVGAVIVALDKRRVTMWLGVATAITATLILIEARWLRGRVLDGISDPVYRDGAEATWSIIVNRLTAQTIGLLLLGSAVALGAWIIGPSERAVAIRERFTSARDDRRSGTATVASPNVRAFQWGVVVLGAVLLLIAPTLSGVLVLTVAIVVFVAVLALEWFAGGS